MKKVVLFLLVCVMLLSLTGCKEKNVEGTLEEIMDKVYANVNEDDLPMMLTNTIIDESNVENYIGTTNVYFSEAIVSESAVGSIAHSVVLLRIADDEVANIETFKKEIKENANPRKWICVEAEDVIVNSKGNLIILIMSTKEKSKLINDAFESL
jgi:hypothetical protein